MIVLFHPFLVWFQPGYDDLNPEVAENPKRRKQMKDFLKAYNIVDANWWSEQVRLPNLSHLVFILIKLWISQQNASN